MESKVIIRDAKVSDQSFIFSSFLKGNYYGTKWFRAIDKDTFMAKYQQILTMLIIKSTTKVACLKGDEDTIVGYSIYEPGVLHYVFVKPPFRKFGIGKSLVPIDALYCTHLTDFGKSIKPSSMKFDPFKI